jgi:hypothetical protein
MTKNWKKFTAEKKSIFLDQKLPFTYPWAFIKDYQATEEAFSPQKRTSSTSKLEIFKFFYFCGSFLPFWIQLPNPDPDSDPLT